MITLECYVQADYSPENWIILLDTKAAGDTNIDNATSVADVMAALNNAQAAMAAVNTLLDDAKEAAHASLNAAFAGYAKDDYSPENWTILVEAMANVTDNAVSVSDVTMALDNAQAAMAAVNTLLTDAKIAAHTNLNTALADCIQADYSPDNWTVLNDFKSAGDTAIDAASSVAEVETAQSAATTGMDGVRTIAQVLIAAKSTALDALAAAFGTYNESDYTVDAWTILNGFKSAGDAAIDSASDLEEVEAAQSAAAAGMDGVQTISQALAAAKAAAHDALAAAFGTAQSNDPVDASAVLTEFELTEDTETAVVAEIDQIEDLPALDSLTVATETEDADTANDAITASQEEIPDVADENLADLEPALEHITLDTTD